MKITPKVQRFLNEENAATAVEYAIMLGLILITCIKTCQIMGTEMNAVFTESHTAMDEVLENQN